MNKKVYQLPRSIEHRYRRAIGRLLFPLLGELAEPKEPEIPPIQDAEEENEKVDVFDFWRKSYKSKKWTMEM